MAKGPTIRQKFREPAASSIGDVPVAGKAAMQMAASNVQKAGMNPFKYRQSSAASAANVSRGGAVGFLGILSSMAQPAQRKPGYYRAAPAPSVFGVKQAA